MDRRSVAVMGSLAAQKKRCAGGRGSRGEPGLQFWSSLGFASLRAACAACRSLACGSLRARP